MTFRNTTADVAFNGALTASANGPTMQMPGGNGSLLIGIYVSAVTGTTPTLAVKLQDSPDGVTFTDVTGAATAANITAAGNVVLAGRSVQKYIRVVTTITGTTPSFTATITVYGAAS